MDSHHCLRIFAAHYLIMLVAKQYVTYPVNSDLQWALPPLRRAILLGLPYVFGLRFYASRVLIHLPRQTDIPKFRRTPRKLSTHAFG